MRTLPALALLGLLMLAPAASAGTEEPACPDGAEPKDGACPDQTPDQAWVDDCPPDMMCAMGNGTAGHDEPVAYGPDGCIDCSGPVESHAGSCMDGTAADCRDDVQYLDGGAEPVRGPVDGSCETCRGDAAEGADGAAASVQSAGLLPVAVLAIAVLALAAFRFR